MSQLSKIRFKLGSLNRALRKRRLLDDIDPVFPEPDRDSALLSNSEFKAVRMEIRK
jgi:hypothetical protein